MIALIFTILVVSAGVLMFKDVSAAVGLPMLAIAAVALMLCLLGVMSVLYAAYNLQDKSQALALPEGSIRAVIALMLVVLFAILAIYLYGSISSGQFSALGEVASASVETLKARFPEGYIVAVDVPGRSGFQNVWIKLGVTPEGNDFAKQVLVLVGTLVTSISSFYFGSRSGGEGKNRPLLPEEGKKDAVPQVQSVEPKAFAPGSGKARGRLLGEFLDGVTELNLANGSLRLPATVVSAAPGEVAFSFDPPADMATGTWDIVATNGAGQSSRLNAAIEVKAP
ncbi:hypothetical protein DKG74_04420 [Zavarzinia aquatilis]|uniref:Uncharacterized protein n=1 Tax=Zavarzinia aquatilis TaxID=2211142 RepID=A0A317EDB3_9PROT|nr:hypothetical protein DKG74_04420 [Zavarzinia aquatilis]